MPKVPDDGRIRIGISLPMGNLQASGTAIMLGSNTMTAHGWSVAKRLAPLARS
jgi:hypothetical protein